VKQLKNKDIRGHRERLLEDQNNICPLCNCEIEYGDAALDHDHDSGRIRGVLHKWCNSAEGMLKSKFKRSGVAKSINFELYLFNLYEYLIKEHHLMLHPEHAPKQPKLMKSSYNKLVREVKNCNRLRQKPERIPDYPRSKKLTKSLEKLFIKYDIDPQFYGSK